MALSVVNRDEVAAAIIVVEPERVPVCRIAP